MSTYSAAILATPGLVSYWRLGEASGTSAADSKGSNTGTIAGSPTMGTTGLLAGDSNTAITFDRTNDTISCGNAASLQLTTLTLEAWVKTQNDGKIMAKYPAYGMHISSGNLGMFDWQNSALLDSGVSVIDNVRHYVVFTIQSGVVGGSQFYVDGVAAGAAVKYEIANQSAGLYLGSEQGSADWLGGVLDEVAVYSTILTPATIANHYAIGATGVDPNASQVQPGLLLPI